MASRDALGSNQKFPYGKLWILWVEFNDDTWNEIPCLRLTLVRQCRTLRNMSAAIPYTSGHAKRVAKILHEEERDAMESHLAGNPGIHPVVSGTGGVRKARWGRQGKGKRGGVRVIYFYRSAADVVYFLDIYAKAVKDDLTPADKQQLKQLVDRLKGVQ